MNTHPVFVFSAFICPEPFDQFSSFLCFHFGLEFLELCQHACQGLLLQWIDVCHPGKIVDKEDVVIRSAIRCWIDRSTQIAVDKFEWLLGPRCRLVGRLPVLLSFQACFAYSHCRPDFYSHSIDHFCQFPDVVLSEMAHTSVADVDVEFRCLFQDLCCHCVRIVCHSESERSSHRADRGG